MTKLVEGFLYGLYMDEELLKSLGFNPVSSRMAMVESYELDLRGLAKIIPKDNSQVWGMLVKLPEDDLLAMYSYETTKVYKPEIVNALIEGRNIISACCYNVPKSNDAALNSEYLEKLILIAKKLNLPIAYIKKLELIGAS